MTSRWFRDSSNLQLDEHIPDGLGSREAVLRIWIRVSGDVDPHCIKMKDTGSFDIHTYHILLRMFIKLERFGPVQEIWKDMCETGIGPDLDSYTLLVHGLCQKKKWRQACHMFMEMIEKGFLPQKVTFDSLYRGLIQADMLPTWRRLKKRVDEDASKFGGEFEKYHLKPYKR